MNQAATSDANELTAQDARIGLVSEILQRCIEVRIALTGHSMVPAIFSGELVTVRRVSAEQVQLGDVLFYVRGGRFVAHRVVHFRDQCGRREFVTRGDALRDDDPPVPETQVLGVVTCVLRRGERLVPHQSRTIAGRAAAYCVRRSNAALALYLKWRVFRERAKLWQAPEAHRTLTKELSA